MLVFNLSFVLSFRYYMDLFVKFFVLILQYHGGQFGTIEVCHWKLWRQRTCSGEKFAPGNAVGGGH